MYTVSAAILRESVIGVTLHQLQCYLKLPLKSQTHAGPISIQVFAIYYKLHYSMVILVIIYGLNSLLLWSQGTQNETKAIYDVCFALFCIRKSIFCVLTPKFVNWFDQKVVRPDVYPAGPPSKVVRPWPDWPYRPRRPWGRVTQYSNARLRKLMRPILRN